jgi:hypothetical protein
MLRRNNIQTFGEGKSMSDLRSRLCSCSGVKWLRSHLLVVCLLASAGSAWAQTTGTLLGVVTDQNGAAIASATVRATNMDTGFAANTISNAEGSYVVPLLPLGHYSISVTASASLSPMCRFQSPRIFAWMSSCK